MHRPLLILTTCFLSIASIAALAASATLQRPAPLIALPSGSATTVLHYYDAVNAMIATGDPTALREVVHPEMIDIDPPPVGPGGRDSVEDYLLYLHTNSPDARLEAGPVAEDGAEVFAQVSVRRESTSLPLGFRTESLSMLWPTFETFLVSNGKIIERHFQWDGLAIFQPAEAFGAHLEIPESRKLEVTLNKFKEGSSNGFMTAEIPDIHYVLEGNVELSLSQWTVHPATVIKSESAENVETSVTVWPGKAHSLDPGDVLIVPSHAAYVLSNGMQRPASTLSVATHGPSATGPGLDTFVLDPIHGFLSRTVFSLNPEAIDAPTILRFGRVTLMPGARLQIDPSTQLMMVSELSGELFVDTARAECAASDTDVDDSNDPDLFSASMWLLCTNGAPEITLLNAGNTLAIAMIVSAVTTSSTG